MKGLESYPITIIYSGFSGKHILKKAVRTKPFRTFRWLAIFLAFTMLGVYQRPGYAFGGAGPYTHLRITYEALARFSEETGWSPNTFCAELLAQGAVVSDNVENMTNHVLHCDNNDLVGCSFALDEFKQEANKSLVQGDSLILMGQALHIVQDFYAHSNWVEIFGFSMVQAPIEQFKDVAPPPSLQTGFFPDIFPDLNAEVQCYFAPRSAWTGYIYGATHGCINKDSNQTFRGIALVPDGFGLTYHELAAEYAIRHSVSLLKYFAAHNPQFSLCFGPFGSVRGCNQAIFPRIH